MATSALPRISAGVPSASVRPRSSTWTRSQTAMISATLWSISSTPAPKSSRTVRTTVGERRNLRLVQAGRRLVHQHEARAASRAPARRRAAARRRAGARPRRRRRARRGRAGRAARRRAARASRADASTPSAATSTFSRTVSPRKSAAVLERAREPGAAAAVRRPAVMSTPPAPPARTTAGRSR